MNKTKKIAVILLFVFVVFLLPFTVHAADKTFIIDEMEFISERDLSELNEYAQKISNTYNIDVAFFLVSNSYSSDQTIYQYIRELYFNIQKLGPHGFVLVHDVDGKTWTMLSFGKTERLITEEIEDWLYETYKTGETYYGGVFAYLEKAEEFLAAADLAFIGNSDELPYVADFAELMTDSQRIELEERAKKLSEKYKCDVHIITVSNMRDYGYTNIEEFSYDIYKNYALGYGPDKDCALIILSMAARDYDCRVWGDYAKTAFTLYGIDSLLDDHVLPILKNNNFYEAFSKYLDRAEVYFKMADEGKPFNASTDPIRVGVIIFLKLAVIIILPLIIAGSLCSKWAKQMKTAVLARTASHYIPKDGFNLTGKEDRFLYRTETKRKIERSSSSSSSGRASSGGRGGSSGRSGKF